MVEAIPAITTDKAVELFERFNVFTKAELESRAEIQYEAYAKAINIEARTMIDMASKQFLPAFIIGLLSDNHRAFTIGTDKFCSYCWYMRAIAFKKGIFIPAIPFLSTL